MLNGPPATPRFWQRSPGGPGGAELGRSGPGTPGKMRPSGSCTCSGWGVPGAHHTDTKPGGQQWGQLEAVGSRSMQGTPVFHVLVQVSGAGGGGWGPKWARGVSGAPGGLSALLTWRCVLDTVEDVGGGVGAQLCGTETHRVT